MELCLFHFKKHNLAYDSQTVSNKRDGQTDRARRIPAGCSCPAPEWGTGLFGGFSRAVCRRPARALPETCTSINTCHLVRSLAAWLGSWVQNPRHAPSTLPLVIRASRFAVFRRVSLVAFTPENALATPRPYFVTDWRPSLATRQASRVFYRCAGVRVREPLPLADAASSGLPSSPAIRGSPHLPVSALGTPVTSCEPPWSFAQGSCLMS